jgi:rod shape-determining protein MreC
MPAYETEGGQGAGRLQGALTGVFLLLAVLALFLPGPAQEAVASTLRGSVLYPFVAAQRGLVEARARGDRIEELQARLDSTLAAVAAQRPMVGENRRLRALLDLRERAGPSFAPATVVRPGTRGSESMFVLDVGTEHGVAVNDPVVSAEGLLGVVREVGPRSSTAMDWTHPDFRVSAMSVDGEVFGMVEPFRGSFREEDRLLLTGTPYHAEIPDSTLIVTSGRGAVYPRGIAVGIVHSLHEAQDGWRRSYWLIPSVTPSAVNHVLVMTGGFGDVPEEEAVPFWGLTPEEGELEEEGREGAGT